jgi:hypothetical protein
MAWHGMALGSGNFDKSVRIRWNGESDKARVKKINVRLSINMLK